MHHISSLACVCRRNLPTCDWSGVQKCYRISNRWSSTRGRKLSRKEWKKWGFSNSVPCSRQPYWRLSPVNFFWIIHFEVFRFLLKSLYGGKSIYCSPAWCWNNSANSQGKTLFILCQLRKHIRAVNDRVSNVVAVYLLPSVYWSSTMYFSFIFHLSAWFVRIKFPSSEIFFFSIHLRRRASHRSHAGMQPIFLFK